MAEQAASADIQVRRVAGHLGADVTGVQLGGSLPAEVIATLRSALLAHKVLFFTDQSLDFAEHVALAARFGPLRPAHPYEDDSPPGYPEVLTVDSQATARKYGLTGRDRRRTHRSFYAGWHSDLTAMVDPPTIEILRAEVVPEFGGDTTWSSLVAAYESLSDPIRGLVDQLTAEHRFLAGMADTPEKPDGYRQKVQQKPYVSVHPVVRVHPETGQRGLFVNPMFTSRVMELSESEGRKVLELLFERIALPAHTVRLRWRPGTVAMWDNRVTAHLAPSDLDGVDAPRRLFRVSVGYEVPTGPDGTRSTAVVAGDPGQV